MESPPPPLNRLQFVSGLAIRFQFGLQLGIGLWLSRSYWPDLARGHAEVAAMHAGGVDRVLQAMHYWGSALLIVHGFLHTTLALWSGGFKRPNGMAFVESTLEWCLAIAFQVTGNILPLDRHAVQTANIEAGVLARAPFIGPPASHVLLHGETFNPKTPPVWYQLHSVILPVLLIGALLALFRPRHEKLTRGEFAAGWAWLPFLVAVSLFIPSPLGSTASAADYTAYDDRVSWYVWPLHGTMRMFDALIPGGGWIGAFLLPSLVLALLLFLPIWGPKVNATWVRAGFASFALVFLAGTIFYGGSFASLTGTRDPVAAAASSAPVATIDRALAAEGRKDFNSLACAGCHGPDGAKPSGGPLLTQEGLKHADAAFYLQFIKTPTSVKADSTMPAFPDLSSGQLRALAEFLRSQK